MYIDISNIALEVTSKCNLKCTYCQDFTAKSSDVSVGDYKEGWSCVIARTDIGRDALLGAEESGLIRTKPLKLDDFIYAKASSLYYKEIMGGYCKTGYIGKRQKLTNFLPLWIVKRKGLKHAQMLVEESRRYFIEENEGRNNK